MHSSTQKHILAITSTWHRLWLLAAASPAAAHAHTHIRVHTHTYTHAPGAAVLLAAASPAAAHVATGRPPSARTLGQPHAQQQHV